MLVYWGAREYICRGCSAQDIAGTRTPIAMVNGQDYLKKLLRPSIRGLYFQRTA